MANKVYKKGDVEIVDVSGIKPLQDIARDCGGTITGLVKGKLVYDETEFVLQPPPPEPTPQELADIKKLAEKEALIQSKLREVAISELKKDGKLDNDGNLI